MEAAAYMAVRIWYHCSYKLNNWISTVNRRGEENIAPSFAELAPESTVCILQDADPVTAKQVSEQLVYVDDSSLEQGTHLKPLPHQVGGHFGIFLFGKSHVAKEVDSAEMFFYEQCPPMLKPFMPELCGTLNAKAVKVNGEYKLMADGFPHCDHEELFSQQQNHLPLLNEDIRKNLQATNWGVRPQMKTIARVVNDGSRQFFLLSNEISAYRYPCVMDVKIGTRQFGDHASPEKKENHYRKNLLTTSPATGLKLVGFKTFNRSNGLYEAITKEVGRKVDEKGMYELILEFVQRAGRQRAQLIEEKLKELIAVIEQLCSYRFFASSLLIAYEGDVDPEDGGDLTLKLIDFSHICFTGYKSDEDTYVLRLGPDPGMMKGLSNLLEKICEFNGNSF